MGESNEPRDGDQFVTTFPGTFVRLWCRICSKTVNLSSVELVERYCTEHECGPRTAPWSSKGQLR